VFLDGQSDDSGVWVDEDPKHSGELLGLAGGFAVVPFGASPSSEFPEACPFFALLALEHVSSGVECSVVAKFGFDWAGLGVEVAHNVGERSASPFLFDSQLAELVVTFEGSVGSFLAP
jgi:hypothetical protein